MKILFEETGIIVPDKQGNLVKISIIELKKLNQEDNNERRHKENEETKS